MYSVKRVFGGFAAIDENGYEQVFTGTGAKAMAQAYADQQNEYLASADAPQEERADGSRGGKSRGGRARGGY